MKRIGAELLPPEVPRRLGIIMLKSYDSTQGQDYVSPQQWKRLTSFAQLASRHARRSRRRR